MALSNKIRELRFKNGEMTQKRLAERVGVSRQTMNAIENCRYAPTVDVAIRIADVFGVTIDQLFDLEYEGKPARRGQARPIAVDRPEITIDRSGELEDRSERAEEGAKRQISMADLAKIIDS